MKDELASTHKKLFFTEAQVKNAWEFSDLGSRKQEPNLSTFLRDLREITPYIDQDHVKYDEEFVVVVIKLGKTFKLSSWKLECKVGLTEQVWVRDYVIPRSVLFFQAPKPLR